MQLHLRAYRPLRVVDAFKLRARLDDHEAASGQGTNKLIGVTSRERPLAKRRRVIALSLGRPRRVRDLVPSPESLAHDLAVVTS